MTPQEGLGWGSTGVWAEDQTPEIPLCRYRARVEKVESGGKVHIFYIDYGNVSGTRESERETSPPSMDPFIHRCVHSWIHPPIHPPIHS